MWLCLKYIYTCCYTVSYACNQLLYLNIHSVLIVAKCNSYIASIAIGAYVIVRPIKIKHTLEIYIATVNAKGLQRFHACVQSVAKVIVGAYVLTCIKSAVRQGGKVLKRVICLYFSYISIPLYHIISKHCTNNIT